MRKLTPERQTGLNFHLDPVNSFRNQKLFTGLFTTEMIKLDIF